MANLPKCSIHHTREIQLPNCKDASEHCNRVYHLLLPSILCDGYGTGDHGYLHQDIRGGEEDDGNQDEFFEGEYRDVGTIPIVFALHGLGTDPRHIARYSKTVDDYNFVFIIPEGINRSFNAGNCCGDAHKFGIHDVDFLQHIQQLLNNEFDFVRPEYSYGVGWDNGGLLLAEASIESPQLFKAIVPIAGYPTRTWMPQSVGTGIGLMMHHSLDDLVMRPSGCCEDPNMPVCRGPVLSKSCVSVLDSFDLWARKVNLCTNDGVERVSDYRSTLQVGGNDGTFYSVAEENGNTSLSFVSVRSDVARASSLTLSTSQIPVSVTYDDDGMVCLTAVSSSCVSNSTLCLYKEMDHFEGLASTPLLGDQVMEFLARDACATNEGTLKTLRKPAGSFDRLFCDCSESEYRGVYCLNERTNGRFENQQLAESLAPDSPLTRKHSSLTYVVVLVLLAVSAILLLMRKHRMKNDSYLQGFACPDTECLNVDDAPRRSSFQDQLYSVKTKLESSMRGPERQRKVLSETDQTSLSGSNSNHLQSNFDDDDGPKSERSDHDCTNSSDGSFRSCRSQSSLKDIDLHLLQLFRKKTNGINSCNRNQEGQTSLDLDIELFKSFRRRQQMVDRFGERDYGSDKSDCSQSSRRSQGLLNDSDLHLLQLYRKKSSGDMLNRFEDENLERRGVYLDMEELNQVGERGLDNSGHDSACSNTSSIRSNESRSLPAYLLPDIRSDDKSHSINDVKACQEEASDLHYDLRQRRTYDSKEYIRNILWDLDFD
ncbi:hypothetical protein HJC23_011436 [Cyclotella cryptica]|uniref:Feruloyl esterase n=1 Tax=Cyclotella cryptica TaxID=29204 RepID=A0ABD3P2A4_9STRA|eukprot:CCRYP_018196-RA/>CCRYP_018196-RA protein AED:0.02 eAED:0.02 QI:290/1/1/1/1/1/2/157/767